MSPELENPKKESAWQKVTRFFDVKLTSLGDFYALFAVWLIAYEVYGKFRLGVFLVGLMVWLLLMHFANRLPQGIRAYFSYGLGLTVGLAVFWLTQNQRSVWALGVISVIFLCVELWIRSCWHQEIMNKIRNKQ